jgi:uncharacterized tellurite resistance protein B-like protein
MSDKWIDQLKQYTGIKDSVKATYALSLALPFALVSYVDRDISTGEVSFTRKYLKSKLNYDDTAIEYLFDFALAVVRKCKYNFNHYDTFFYCLNSALKEDDKRDFLANLYVLSRQDMEIEKNEEKVIMKVIKQLNMDELYASGFKAIEQFYLDCKAGLDTSETYQVVHGAEKFEI